jgi:hypothetical protein
MSCGDSVCIYLVPTGPWTLSRLALLRARQVDGHLRRSAGPGQCRQSCARTGRICVPISGASHDILLRFSASSEFGAIAARGSYSAFFVQVFPFARSDTRLYCQGTCPQKIDRNLSNLMPTTKIQRAFPHDHIFEYVYRFCGDLKPESCPPGPPRSIRDDVWLRRCRNGRMATLLPFSLPPFSPTHVVDVVSAHRGHLRPAR